MKKDIEQNLTPEPLEFTLIKPELPKVVIQHILQLMVIYEVSEAYFFGSRIRNLQNDWSDFDVAFEVGFEKRYKDTIKDPHYKAHIIDVVLTKDVNKWSEFVSGTVKMTKQELQILLHLD